MLDLSKYLIIPGYHKDKMVIWIHFENDINLTQKLRTHIVAKWSASNSAWYAPDQPTNRLILGLDPLVLGKEALSKVRPINLPALQLLENELKLKAYSQNTIKTYTVEFAQLLYILKDYP